jgi:hypothetical protein
MRTTVWALREELRHSVPNTASKQFTRLGEVAEVRLITLHDVRHSHSFVALRTHMDSKSKRTQLSQSTVTPTPAAHPPANPERDAARSSNQPLIRPQRHDKRGMILVGGRMVATGPVEQGFQTHVSPLTMLVRGLT